MPNLILALSLLLLPLLAGAQPAAHYGDLALTLDPSRRNAFIKRWNEAVDAGRKQEKLP